VESLERTLATLVAEARARVASGREPDTAALETRLRAALRQARGEEDADTEAIGEAETAARASLARVGSVWKARQAVAREAAPAPPAPAARPGGLGLRSGGIGGLKTKPTITGSLDVRRVEGEGFHLVWDATPLVTEWEVRLSERPDTRSDYIERETILLEGTVTSIEIPLGERPFRVNVLGRGRGKLQRRALISGLTRESWRDRWQRRATAS
jgi:hypothetical protein